jgi:hypothetical protein
MLLDIPLTSKGNIPNSNPTIATNIQDLLPFNALLIPTILKKIEHTAKNGSKNTNMLATISHAFIENL